MEKEEFLPVNGKDSAINKLLESYMQQREKIRFPTNKKGFDEDVNIYIAHLLFAIAMPNYNYITEQYVSHETKDVQMLIDLAEDNYLKYFIYKVNGDNLFLQLGLFHDLKAMIRFDNQHNGILKEEDFIQKAKMYYQEAANCNRKIHRKKTALSEVLMKLVKNFSYYGRALSEMKKDYYFFYDFYEDEEFSGFNRALGDYEKKLFFQEKQDQFLELYSKWLHEKSPALKKSINVVCREMHEIEPTFHFHID